MLVGRAVFGQSIGLRLVAVSPPDSAGKKTWLRIGRKAAVTLVLAYALIVVAMMFLEESLLFFPTPYPDGLWDQPGLDPEDAWFEAADGTRLHGWYVHHDKPRAVILFCHGNAGNVTHRSDVLQVLRDQVGASALVFDYRGYGRSEGSPNERGILEDARAARKWLAQREGIPEDQVVVMGESLGGGVAVDLAAKDGAKALVLQSTFTSIPDVAAHYYPWLPVRWLIRNRLDSLSKIASYRGPLLASHGDADTIIPFVFGQRLFEAANEPKQFVVLEGLDHNDSPPRAYYETLGCFLDKVNAAAAGHSESPKEP